MNKEKELLARFEAMKTQTEATPAQVHTRESEPIEDINEEWREAEIEAARAHIAEIEILVLQERTDEIDTQSARPIMVDEARRLLPEKIARTYLVQ